MMVHQDIGKRLLNEVLDRLLEVGKIEQEPKMEGRHMTVMLIPEKKKIDQYLKTHKKPSVHKGEKAEVEETETASTVVNTEAHKVTEAEVKSEVITDTAAATEKPAEEKES
jgi:hypothetical protein